MDVLADPNTTKRGGRTRLRTLNKPPPGVISFIPVRRADRRDHVDLQRSEAQELALATRANTRRNKGQAKMPKYVLKGLKKMEITEDVAAGSKEAGWSKAVNWDETLVYFQEEGDAKAPKREKPKVRASKDVKDGVGEGQGSSANGMPAAKRKLAERDL